MVHFVQEQMAELAHFNQMAKKFGNVRLADYLPPNLAEIATREVNINNVPVAGMLSVILFLTCIFSPMAYVAGLGTNIQPLILLFGNIGHASINKSGLHDLCIRLYRDVVATLDHVRRDFSGCMELRMMIPKSNLPA
jgi:hypothetical protein